MTRSKVMVSGDPLSLSRKAELTKLAFETELSKNDLADEIEVGYMGQVSRTDLLPLVIVFPDGAVYGPVNPEDASLIVEEHLLNGRVVDYMLAPEEITADVVESIGKVATAKPFDKPLKDVVMNKVSVAKREKL